MKTMKRMMAVMLAVIMALAMTVTAFAAEKTVTVTVTNAPDNTTVYAFKLMNVVKNGDLYDYTLDNSAQEINNALKTALRLGETFDAEDVYNAIKGKESSMNAFANDFVTAMGGVTNATVTATTTMETATFANLADGYYLFYVPNVNSAVKTVVGNCINHNEERSSGCGQGLRCIRYWHKCWCRNRAGRKLYRKNNGSEYYWICSGFLCV